jgi:hypothetical protein
MSPFPTSGFFALGCVARAMLGHCHTDCPGSRLSEAVTC